MAGLRTIGGVSENTLVQSVFTVHKQLIGVSSEVMNRTVWMCVCVQACVCNRKLCVCVEGVCVCSVGNTKNIRPPLSKTRLLPTC